MRIDLVRLDPAQNLARWYRVEVGATLFCPHSVICQWGRLGGRYQRARYLSALSHAEALALANLLVRRKVRRGYWIVGG